MAVTITSIATAGGVGAGPGFVTGATVTATTANNDWLVVVISCQENLSISSVTDSSGNTYTSRVSAGFTEGGTLGARVGIYTAPVTVNITSGTVTVTLSAGSTVAAVEVYRVRPSSGTVTFVAADNAATGANATGHPAATVSVTNGNTIFGVGSIETNDSVTGDSDTTNGSWSTVSTVLADSGSDAGSQSVISQYKTVNATGNQSWNCFTTSARRGISSYLVLHGEAAAFSLAAALGQYTLSGTAATMRLGNAPLVAGAGSYSMTGTAATLTPVHKIDAAAGSYVLTGTNPATTHAWKVTADVGTYALTGTAATPILSSTKRIQPDSGSYALTGTDAAMVPSHAVVADAGSYALTGITAPVLHAWRLVAGAVTIDELLVQTGYGLLTEDGLALLLAEQSVGGSYALTGTDVALNASTGDKTVIADVGSYVLTGTAATLTLATAPKSIVAESGSYLLTGTAVTLTSSAQPVQPAVSPLHIGEWPIDKRKRRARENAAAVEQRARKRFRDAIGRLLEGLPPEFDEPADLDEALDSAVQASNLLYALSAPIREINAVNELIDHIMQLRIAQPIAQLHLAQAYNQAHRHLMAKAQEDTVMALLLGE